MKRILLAAVTMTLCLMPSTLLAFTAKNSDGKIFYYEIDNENDKTCYVAYTDSTFGEDDARLSEEINIPEYANGYKVTGIGPDAFHCCSAKKVTIPNSVIGIGAFAFAVSSLESVTFGNSLKSIGDMAFINCPALKSVDIPNSVISIGVEAFDGCVNLESVTFGNSLKTIEAGAFYNCKSLAQVVLPESVTSIGDFAFFGCTSLASIIIPNSVTTIGREAFSGCTGLEKVIIGESVTSISSTSFKDCNNITQLELNMKHISSTFKEHPNLKTLVLGDNVEIVGDSAFHLCSIESVSFGNSIKSIGECAFWDCVLLKSLTLPNSLTSIGANAFYNCLSLISVEIPNSVVSIGDFAFTSCEKISTITIPNSVRSIGMYAFAGCTNLTTVKSYITDVFETGKEVFCLDDDATLYVPYGLSGEYSSTEAWNYIQNIIEMEPEVMSIQIACNSKGNVNINGGNDLTGNIALVNLDNNENTFIFTPKPGSKLEQVVLNGIDITTNVENNMLTCTIPANSQMIVTFASDQGDVNNDGLIDISDVVSIVNKILGN